MKNFLNNLFNSLVVQLIVTLLIATIPSLTGLITGSLTSIGVASFILMILWPFVIWAAVNRLPNPANFENTSTNKTRYSILIIDDEFGKKKNRASEAFAEYFTGWDMHQLKTINDARLTESYDIVIMDILGANESRGNTIDIFNEINKLYPEKYIIAMSQNGPQCKELFENHFADDYYTKPTSQSLGGLDVEAWRKETQKALDNAFSAIDNPVEYWAHIEKKMVPATKKQIKLAKKRYVAFLQSHSNFKKKRLIH